MKNYIKELKKKGIYRRIIHVVSKSNTSKVSDEVVTEAVKAILKMEMIQDEVLFEKFMDEASDEALNSVAGRLVKIAKESHCDELDEEISKGFEKFMEWLLEED